MYYFLQDAYSDFMKNYMTEDCAKESTKKLLYMYSIT